MPGGIDTDAIRRAWPDLLAKIFTIRRFTWTFLSDHAQVLDFNGERLLLGIQTEGLASTFRRGQHAELVRQALSEVLGVDAVVEGRWTAQYARPEASPVFVSPPAGSPPAASPVSVSPPAASPPAASPISASPVPASPPSGSAPANPSVPSVTADAQADPGTADSADLAVRLPEALPSGGSPVAIGTQQRTPTPRERATAAVAAEVRTRKANESSSADDSMVSIDDEDIEESGAVGQPVIARVLGGTVIGELDQ